MLLKLLWLLTSIRSARLVELLIFWRLNLVLFVAFLTTLVFAKVIRTVQW
jgi:hypothetical protein